MALLKLLHVVDDHSSSPAVANEVYTELHDMQDKAWKKRGVYQKLTSKASDRQVWEQTNYC